MCSKFDRDQMDVIPAQLIIFVLILYPTLMQVQCYPRKKHRHITLIWRLHVLSSNRYYMGNVSIVVNQGNVCIDEGIRKLNMAHW